MHHARRLELWFAVFILQFFPLSHGSNLQSRLARLPKLNIDPNNPMVMAQAQSGLRGTQNARYEKVADNLKCDGRWLVRQNVGSLSECQSECTRDERCNFMAYWVKRKRCETYEKCDSKSEDGDNKILLYRRIDECKEMIKDGDAPFYLYIAAQFPTGVVRPKAPRRNLACFCTAWNWMICAIFLVPESGEFTAVLKRIDRSSEAKLKPFYTAYPDEEGRPMAPIMISYEEKVKVFAEIEPLPFYRCGTVAMCTDGTPDGECPVYGTEFASGQAVFILKIDEEKVVDRQPVPCISAVGLRVLASIHGQDTVMAHREVFIKRDPWGRQPGRNLIVGVDYIMVFIFDDHDLRSGICGDDSDPMLDEPETSSATTSEQPFQEDPPEASPESGGKSSPRKGKSRGGGKKKKKSMGLPELEAVPSDADSPTPFSLRDEPSGFQSFIAKQQLHAGSKSPEDGEEAYPPIAPTYTSPDIAPAEYASEGGAESDDSDAREESPRPPEPAEPSNFAAQSSSGAGSSDKESPRPPEPAEPSNFAAQSSSGAGSSDMHAGIPPQEVLEEDSSEWNVVSRRKDASNSKAKVQQSQTRPSPRMRPSPRLTSKQQNLPPPASQSIIPSRAEAQERKDSPRAFPLRGDTQSRGDSSSALLPKSSWASIAASGKRLESPAISPELVDTPNPSLRPTISQSLDKGLELLAISPERVDTPNPSLRPTISQSLDKGLESLAISPKRVDSIEPTLQPTILKSLSPPPSTSTPATAADDSSTDASEYHRMRKEARKRNKKVPSSFLDDEALNKGTVSSPKSPVSGENVVVSLDSLAASPLVDKEPADRLPIRNYQSSPLPRSNRPQEGNLQRPPSIPRTQEKSTQDDKPVMEDKSTQWEEDHVSQTQKSLQQHHFLHIFTFFSCCFIIFTNILTSMLHKPSRNVYVEFQEVA